MFDRIILRMRECIRTRRYVMTLHAEEELDADHLTVFDVENVILTGEIIERQKDRESAKWKYLINGQSLAGESVFAVAKLGQTGKLVFVTIFKE